jgi:Leucine-rich repeat (LRR) protein
MIAAIKKIIEACLYTQLKSLTLCCLCILFQTHFVQAQLLDSIALSKTEEYTNLDSALKHPEQVIKLVLKKQHLKSFPKEIARLKNLQYLDISKNTIEELPEEIGQLTQLQYFICSKTGLLRLPKEIGDLANLRYINVNQNELESLPPQFGRLSKLEIADMWSNDLADFPESLGDLKALKAFDLRNILISEEQQRYLQELLPKATLYLSPPCKCKL